MKVNYHAVNFKISDNLKRHIEEKLEKPIQYFSNVTKIDVYLKVERSNNIIELVVFADDEKFYFSQKSNDMYSATNKLVKKAAENIRKFKSKQKKHSSRKYIHHNNHVIITKNIKTHKDIDSDIEIFSKKPISKLEAYLELKISKNNILIFRDIKDFMLNIMIKDNDKYYLINKKNVLLGFIKIKTGKMDFVKYEIENRNNKIIVLNKEKLHLEILDKSSALKKMKKQKFLLYYDKNDKDLNILFVYNKNKVGLIEHIEVYK